LLAQERSLSPRRRGLPVAGGRRLAPDRSQKTHFGAAEVNDMAAVTAIGAKAIAGMARA
jgi:hypothetical protein